MGYVILENEDALRLAAEVSQRMAKGWAPLGGVACYYHARREVSVYAQAMVLTSAVRPAPDGAR